MAYTGFQPFLCCYFDVIRWNCAYISILYPYNIFWHIIIYPQINIYISLYMFMNVHIYVFTSLVFCLYICIHIERSFYIHLYPRISFCILLYPHLSFYPSIYLSMDLSVSNLSQRLLIAWKPVHILYLHGLVSGVPPLQTLSLSCPVPGRLREQIRQWPRRGGKVKVQEEPLDEST